MSDLIQTLPINEYSNPSKEEIQILDTLFPKQSTIKQTKISIVASLLYIILFLITQKCKYKTYIILPLTSIIMCICIYVIQMYLIL